MALITIEGSSYTIADDTRYCIWYSGISAPYELGPEWAEDEPSLQTRVSVSDNILADGGSASGDRFFKSRTITFMFPLLSQSDSAYRTAINALAGIFSPRNKPWYLYDATNNIRTEIELQSIDPKVGKPGNQRRYSTVRCSFYMPRGMWEDSIETADNQSPTDGWTDQDTWTIDIDSAFPAFPIVEVTPMVVVSSALDNFTIYNDTQDAAFEISDSSLTEGLTITIDTRDGTITLSGVSRVQSLTSGGMIKLLPGTNTLRFESARGAAQVNVRYRERYAF